MSYSRSVHLETTPRAYYTHYMSAVPSYDLYPALSRRLGNGYVHRPIRPVRTKDRQMNFAAMNIAGSRRERHFALAEINWQQLTQQHQRQMIQQEAQDVTPPWDLYPSVLRNVENLGTDQMRQRLHAMEATLG
ncbi:uncharacterized protein BYT42DRAFT_554989 [Radiomyces spectabilis]|uniref:uncharacterized protein n=1 Tax=Radiomyces spectabilis TaxID=64574 RepID=UPI00221EEA3A|nr:uncharacterized protein BYT42DRAFT_554989 [Radiomyces spectabilis]KAI8390950.1 hypothetical protein BYT42DRAFT_554989 [Radiomyces spectabilis]